MARETLLSCAQVSDMSWSQDSLKACQRLAENGDPDAQMALAWQYYKGEILEKNFDKAIALFRQAELKKPSLARFYLAKAKILNGDNTFADDLLEDCNAGFGPALYTMAVAEKRGIFREENLDEALRYFALAARDNHWVSEIYLWRLEKKSILEWLTTFPHAVRLLVRIFIIKVRDRSDLRVLT
jgi:TPR repeat protein